MTAAAFAFWGGTQLLESRLAPADCRWCDPGSLDASVRSSLRWDDTSAANLASNLGAYVFVPLTSLGLLALDAHGEGRLGELPGDGLVIAEAVALNGALTQIVKFAAGRERPFVNALPAAQKPLTAHPADNNVSFYSSHTSFAFSLAVSTATVASMRRYRWAPADLGGGVGGRSRRSATCASPPTSTTSPTCWSARRPGRRSGSRSPTGFIGGRARSPSVRFRAAAPC